MMEDRDITVKPGGRGIGLAAKLIVAFLLLAAVVALTAATGWWMLRSIGDEIMAMRTTAAGDGIAAMTDRLLNHVNEGGIWLAAGAFLGFVFLAGVYLYIVRVIVRPLQENARHMGRLAIGDCREDVSARQLAREDELGELARAIRDVTAYQREEVAVANNMAAGDFTAAMAVRDSSDALGMAIQRMAGVTTDTLRRVQAHAGQVMTGCEAIASATRELSANTAEITTATTEISTGIARIRTHADDNSGVAEQTSRLTGAGDKFVERGYEDIGEMGIVMLNMQSCGDKIVGIAKSIGDIAFQTNLLSLNASVEAARAGRHGKGFTIVAEEVRNLSVRTSKAAEETSTLMKETVEQVELAAAIAGRINATFAEMQTNIREADGMLTKIASASREQSGDLEQISAILRRMEQSAKENAAHAVDVLEKADSLIGQTGRLHQAMGRFRLGGARPPDFESIAIGEPKQFRALAWNQDAQR